MSTQKPVSFESTFDDQVGYVRDSMCLLDIRAPLVVVQTTYRLSLSALPTVWIRAGTVRLDRAAPVLVPVLIARNSGV